MILYEELSPSRVFSKQLAHNSIAGASDPELIKRVWGNISDIGARFESYIDPKLFETIPSPVKFQPVDVDMQELQEHILIVFLSSQAADFDRAVEAMLPPTQIDKVYLASKDTFDGWRKAINKTRQDLEIISVPTAIAEMARLAVENLEQKEAEADE